MKALILSDIHSNLEALESVIDDAGSSGGFDEVWALGDLVGYGPDPGACIELLRQHDARCVAGNHDLAVSGRLGLERFNEYAAAAARWTIGQLDDTATEYLRGLPLRLEMYGFTAVHGSPRDPVWEVRRNLSCGPRRVRGHRYAALPGGALPRAVCLPARRRRPGVPARNDRSGGAARREGHRQSRQCGPAPRRRPPGQLRGLRLECRYGHSPQGGIRHTGYPAQDARARLAPLPLRAAGLRPVIRVLRRIMVSVSLELIQPLFQERLA